MASKTKKTTPEVSQPQPINLINETYVDGVLSISVRQNIAKIDFYQASPIMSEDGVNEQKEFRKMSQRLVLPVAGLAEIHDILGKMQTNQKDAK